MDPEQGLPISPHREHIVSQILSNPTTIICGETGSGKTTQVPQYLYPHFRNILVTQPRRISAITLAQRVASEMGLELGQEIGYCVRFEEKRVIGTTRITFMTDGMAIRQIMAGRNFDVYVVDEAHERSINTDVLMALLRDRVSRMQARNENVKGKNKQKNTAFNKMRVVIMSATIQANKFLQYFDTSSIVRIQGRSYPTQIYNLLSPVENYLEAAYNAILQIHYTEQPGDILAFLTGQQQILTLSKRLTKTIFEHSIQGLSVLTLYSAMPYDVQQKIFMADELGNRKVILATNIAETSITINGLRYVVDPGFMKIRVYDTGKGVDMLAVVPVAKANSVQRAGRAGREGEGKCFRLFTSGDFQSLKEYVVPQILRSELSGPILQLKSIGIPKISNLKFLDQPPTQTIQHCLQLLCSLNCLTQSQEVTQYGIEVSKIPLPPYLSNLLIKSHEFKCEQLMLNVLSVLSVDNLFFVTKESREENGKGGAVLEILKKYMVVYGGTYLWSDHLAKANILEEYIATSNKKGFSKANHLNRNNINRAIQIREQLYDYLQQILSARDKKSFQSLTSPKQQSSLTLNAKFRPTPQQITSWLNCMEKNNKTHIARLNREGMNYTIQESGQVAYIHPESLLFFVKVKPQLVVFSQVVKTSRLYLRDVTGLSP